MAVDASRWYMTAVPLLLALLTFDDRLTATEGGTRIVERISFSGPLAGRYVKIPRRELAACLVAEVERVYAEGRDG